LNNKGKVIKILLTEIS